MKDGTITFVFMLLFIASSIAWYMERHRNNNLQAEASHYETLWRGAEVIIDSLSQTEQTIINQVQTINKHYHEKEMLIAAVPDSMLAQAIRTALGNTYANRGQADTLQIK
jgi:lipopolysaccharide biosynthesis regulator YciM